MIQKSSLLQEHFTLSYTFCIFLKVHVRALKIGLVIPIYTSTFPQDFSQFIFQQKGPMPPQFPLKTAYKQLHTVASLQKTAHIHTLMCTLVDQ